MHTRRRGFAQRRRARGYSQERFAAAAKVDRTTIARWEAGETDPQPWLRPTLAQLLDVTLDQLDDLLVNHESGARRQAPPVPSVGDRFHELRDRIRSAAAVDAQAIDLLAAQANNIRLMDRMLGASAAEAQLNGYLDALQSLRMFSISPNQRRPLGGLHAQAATLAGWQRLDRLDLPAAWRHYEEAKNAAREAESTTDLAHSMAEQAYVLRELDEPEAALQLATHALSVAGTRVPSLMRAWLHAAVGEFHAHVGDWSASRQAFDTSAQLLPADPRDPLLPYVVLGDVHLDRWSGAAMAKLGDTASIDQLHSALGGLDQTFTRARAGMHVDLAGALYAAGRHQEARSELVHASHLANRIGSARQRKRARQLTSALDAA
ncbi:helix-turn-helix domain-containing protein [Jiangella alkaliphila]|uniref:DNA-binding transcriptional regulator, XRE-family HTH domain n=1 Tax=Jiangella alkaliphila TaxID=419479 RepID=A0A1H2L8N9_9ACTN|nr:helix-turn-helix transcriptional regulator [Jiangella alkaliphila]SDU77075.1 DNA-binding transcriptional regulator, XRE-family HTH domain [Jiangella alkaliphila]